MGLMGWFARSMLTVGLCGSAFGQVVGPVPTASAPQVPVPAAGDPLFAPIATGTAPETFGERFADYAVVTFGPRALISPAFAAGIRMAHPKGAYPKNWKDGGGALGRNYGDALASKATMQTGRFITAALLHEDFRYRISTREGGWARFLHAVRWTIVDQSDGGGKRLAFANLVGAAAGGFVGDAYLPAGFDNVAHAGERAGLRLAEFGIENVTREFAPEIFRAARKLHLPGSNGGPIPEWWTRDLTEAKP